jgi:hypothetical protein
MYIGVTSCQKCLCSACAQVSVLIMVQDMDCTVPNKEGSTSQREDLHKDHAQSFVFRSRVDSTGAVSLRLNAMHKHARESVHRDSHVVRQVRTASA